jgi:adenylosuccinate lyase
VLLALTQAGMSREDAYAAVQRAAMATWEALGTPEARSFRDALLADPAVRARLEPAALDSAMDPRRDFAQVDSIFDRVFTEA